MSKYDIADETIIETVNGAFGLNVDSLEHIPVGEASDSYIASVNDKPKYVVKVQKKPEENIINVIGFLNDNYYKWIPRIHFTRDDSVWHKNHEYQYSVQDYVDSDVNFTAESIVDETILSELADALSDLHSLDISETNFTEENRNREDEIVAELFECIDNLKQRSKTELALKKLSDLVSENRETIDILTNNYKNTKPSSLPNPVLTHGDAHLGNVLKPKSEHLYLIDWDMSALSQPEKDFMFLSDEQLQIVLRYYRFRQEVSEESIKHYRSYVMLRAYWHYLSKAMDNSKQVSQNYESLKKLFEENQFLSRGMWK